MISSETRESSSLSGSIPVSSSWPPLHRFSCASFRFERHLLCFTLCTYIAPGSYIIYFEALGECRIAAYVLGAPHVILRVCVLDVPCFVQTLHVYNVSCAETMWAAAVVPSKPLAPRQLCCSLGQACRSDMAVYVVCTSSVGLRSVPSRCESRTTR